MTEPVLLALVAGLALITAGWGLLHKERTAEIINDLEAPSLSSGQAGAIVLAAVLVGSAVLMPVVPGGDANAGTSTNATATPQAGETIETGESANDLIGVPETHIDTIRDLSSTTAPDAPSEVATSDGSQTMRVDTTTVDGEPALVLSDDETHDGRWVSVPTAWLETVHGSIPETVTVQHESGDNYVEPVRVRDDSAAFYVREFSTNTVTFSGSVEINAAGAENGTGITYDINDADSTSDPDVTFTGAFGTERDTTTGSVLDGSIPVNVAGSHDPVNATLTLDAGERQHFTDSGGADETFVTSAVDSVKNITFVVENQQNDGTDNTFTPEVRVDGSTVCTFDQTTLTYPGDKTYSCTINTTVSDQLNIDSGASSDDLGIVDISIYGRNPANVTVAANGTTVDFGTFNENESKTKTIDMALSTSSVEVTNNDGGDASYTLSYTERQQTTGGAVVSVNGNNVSVSGTLAPGETATRTGSSAWLTSSNTIDVWVGNGSLSADAPDPAVDIKYTHEASDQQSVDYASERWSTRYNVSKSYASSRADAHVTIPFDASQIVSVRSVEYRINESGGWSTVSQANYVLDGAELQANLSDAYGGQIPAGTTVEVRAAGSKVNVLNGSITVLDATPANQTLDTKISVDSADSEFAIETSDSRIHYTANESADAGDYWVVDEAGQRLNLPEASAGDTMRVQTIPVTASPQSGDVRVEVDNASDTEPSFAVKPAASTSDDVAFTFETAADGTDYVLWSKTYGIVRDSGTANSPLTLSDDDSIETLQFRIDDGSAASDASGGGGGGGGAVGIVDASGGQTDWVALVGIALTLGLLVVVSRNSETVTDAGADAADGIEGAFDGLPVVGPAVGSALGGGVQATAQLARATVENRTIALSLGLAVAYGALQAGIIAVPPGSTVIILVAAIGAVSFVGLRETGEFDIRVWAGILVASATTAAVIVGDSDPVAAVLNSEVFPLIAAGGLYLAYVALDTVRSTVTSSGGSSGDSRDINVNVSTDGSGGDD